MHTTIVLYLISVPILMVGDLLWLGFIAKDFYQGNLRHLLAPEPNLGAALFFYIVFPLGLTFFATLPGFESGSLFRTFALGALFGFFTYMTYNLTNIATLRDWPLHVSIADMLWGTAICGVVSMAAVLLYKIFF